MKGCNGDGAEGLESLGVDCVVVGSSYGRVLQPVSNKDSLRPVKLSAGKHVTLRARRAQTVGTSGLFPIGSAGIASTPASEPRPTVERAAHLPRFAMQTVGCVAKGVFANESPDKYLMIAAPRPPE
jgi:hypothetical protein